MVFSNFFYIIPILFGIYFILIRYTQNLNEVSNTDLMFIFSIFLPIIALFTLIMKIIIKNNIKSILISSLVIILFFTYMPLHNLFFDSEIKENETSSHILLFSSLLITLFVVVFFLIKSKNNFEKILKILFAISLSLILFNMVEITYYSTTNELFTDNSSEFFSVNQDNLRDVYFIILDAHASTPALKQYFNYDNSNFNNFLKEKEFFIPKLSFSNYFETRLAMASVLNMDYLNFESKSEKEQNLILKKMMVDNAVVKNFERNGYEIVSFDNEYNLEPSSKPHNVCNGNVRSITLLVFVLSTTPFEIFKNIIISLLDETSSEGEGDVSFQPVIENRKCVFNELSNIDNNFSHPKFVFVHMIVPHAPYVFDSKGNIVNARTFSDSFSNPSAYLAQLQYTDMRIQDSVEKLLENEPKPIIIIQSDHGFRFQIDENDDPNKHGFLNFAAYYFPDEELNEDEYSVITPANTFRILFNEYFGTDYEILDNKAFLRENSKFNEVTEFVISNSKFE